MNGGPVSDESFVGRFGLPTDVVGVTSPSLQKTKEQETESLQQEGSSS